MNIARIILLLLFASQCFGANHYIRAGASGANDGTSWANAWPTFSAATFVRGDTYYVAGGTYNESPYINVSLSGTTPIVIKKANATDNSADAGWSASYATTVAQINGTLDLDRGYVTVNGVTGSGTSGYGIVIHNASFSNVLTLENADGFSVSHCEIQGAGVAASTTAYSGVSWNNIAAAKKGAYLGYNWIHEVTTNGVQVIGAVGTSYSDYGLLFENNYVTETGLCLDVNNHGQGMQLGQASEMGFCVIRNNVFRNNTGSAIITWLTSGNGANHHDNQIYNNIGYITNTSLYNVISPGVIWHEAIKTYSGCNNSNMLIANNVFYNITGGSNLGQIVLEMDNGGIQVTNNIWEGCAFTALHTGVDTNSYNGYYNCAGTVQGGTNKITGSASTFTNASAYDFTLASGGYAVSAGTSMASSFTTDITGATRSQWDLGAYAYSGASPPTQPPARVRRGSAGMFGF